MKFGFVLITPIVLVLAFASAAVAQAQEPPSLRAAPPEQPDVLKRAPETVLGIDASTVQMVGGWVALGTDAVSKFGESGEKLVDVTRGDFVGSGGTRNRLKNLWNARFDAWRGLSEGTRNTLPYQLAPQLFQLSDFVGAVVDPALVGDGRGAVSGAVNLGATTAASSAGSAGGEWFGAVIGGAVGSFIPVVGNVAGATVGGAIGTFAGGYLASAGYEAFLKDSVAQGIEAGIAAIVDPDPLMDMIVARQQALYQKLPPEVAEMIATSQSMGGGEAQLLDWGSLVPTPAPKGITLSPDAQQQAVLGDGVPASFELNQNVQINYPLACTIRDAHVACSGRHRQGADATLTISLTGTVSGNTFDVEAFTVYEATSGCTSRAEYRGRDKFVLEKGGRAVLSGSYTATQKLRGSPCPSGPTSWSNNYSNVIGSWRPN